MNCLECRELLHQRLDGEPIASGAIEQHLSQCALCREQHAVALLLLDGLKQIAQPKPPAQLARSIAAQVVHDRRARQHRMRRRVFATMALAASVLFMLMLAYYWLPRPDHVEPTPKDKLVKDAPKKDVPPRQHDPKDVVKRDQRSPLTALTDRWADTTRDHAKVVLAGMNLDGMDKLPPVGALPVNPSVREAGQEVSDGVQTVTRNARKALDFFARELPMPDLGEQKN